MTRVIPKFLLPLLLLVVAGMVNAQAAGAWEGYRGAQFGMSQQEVEASFEANGVELLGAIETADNDVILEAQRGDGASAVHLRYIFPAAHAQLALVIEFLPDTGLFERHRAHLTARYGQPWSADLTEWTLEQMGDNLPDGAQDLVAWGGGEGNRTRFVRLWTHEEHLSVEYIDAGLLSGY